MVNVKTILRVLALASITGLLGGCASVLYSKGEPDRTADCSARVNVNGACRFIYTRQLTSEQAFVTASLRETRTLGGTFGGLFFEMTPLGFLAPIFGYPRKTSEYVVNVNLILQPWGIRHSERISIESGSRGQAVVDFRDILKSALGGTAIGNLDVRTLVLSARCNGSSCSVKASPDILAKDGSVPVGPKEIAQTSSAISPHSDVDEPGYRFRGSAHDFAVVVGVEKYSNDLPAAQFAERDAQAVRNHLVAMGYPERNIKFLLGNRATKGKLEGIIEDWLPRNAKKDGRVFFYFSGHGAPDIKSKQAYLVPWDGDPNLLNKTAYPLKKLYADLSALKARQVIVALDSCFSGAGGRSIIAAGIRPLVTTVDSSLNPGSNLVLFTAASSQETAGSLPDQQHGIFTYYFLKGLNTYAKRAGGTITSKTLYEYIRPKVQDAASRQNQEQTPGLEGPSGAVVLRESAFK